MNVMDTSLLAEADLAIVGAGIVGLAHALEAVDRGLSVVVVDRDGRAVGASVRNFGHGFVSAMAPGRAHACAQRSRERWLQLGADAGIAVTPSGTLMLLQHADEVAAAEAAATRTPRHAASRMLTPRQARALAPVAVDGVRAALYAPGDLRVDSERAVGQLAAYLERARGVRFHWRTVATAVEPHRLSTTRGMIRAARILVCPGPDVQTLFGGTFAQRPGLTRTKLQMLEVDAPHARRYAPALVSGLSLLHYPAFNDLPEVEAIRARLAAQRPEILAHGIHLIITQRPDGRLVVGDTHERADTVSPFGDEHLDELLLAEAARLLGVDRLRVRRRWHGVYPSAPGEPFLIAAPLPGVRVVSVVSGVGMTTALGLAPLVLDDLLQLAAVQPSVPVDEAE